MRTLKIFNPTSKKSPYYSIEDNQILIYEIIEPLKNLGFSFSGTISTEGKDEQGNSTESGAHILQFNHNGDIEYSFKDLEFLNTWDESSNQTFNHYFGTLIVIINWSA